MRALLAAELLSVWEQGRARPSVEQALTLIAAACPETSPEALARLSIGQRDSRLLTLREWMFGPKLAGLAVCPACGQRLEMTFDVSDIRLGIETEPAETLSLTVAGYEVRFRLPNSLDLAAVGGSEGIAVTRQLLFERCLLAAHCDGEERSAEQLPANVVAAVVERMAQVDPQADAQLALSCPSCRHQWQEIFDIASFFWSEISVWSSRILREVHALASAYRWREADILAMSPWRRQFYLEMVGR